MTDPLQSTPADPLREAPRTRLVANLVNAACLQEREPNEANQNAYWAARRAVEAAIDNLATKPAELAQDESVGKSPTDQTRDELPQILRDAYENALDGQSGWPWVEVAHAAIDALAAKPAEPLTEASYVSAFMDGLSWMEANPDSRPGQWRQAAIDLARIRTTKPTEPLFALLAGMVRPLEGVDRNQPGYENAKGWNDALRQVADYVRGGALATKPAETPKNHVAAMMLEKMGCVWNGEYWEGSPSAAPPSSPEPLRQVVESHTADLEHFARVRRDPTRGEIEKAIEELRAALAAKPAEPSEPPPSVNAEAWKRLGVTRYSALAHIRNDNELQLYVQACIEDLWSISDQLSLAELRGKS